MGAPFKMRTIAICVTGLLIVLSSALTAIAKTNIPEYSETTLTVTAPGEEAVVLAGHYQGKNTPLPPRKDVEENREPGANPYETLARLFAAYRAGNLEWAGKMYTPKSLPLIESLRATPEALAEEQKWAMSIQKTEVVAIFREDSEMIGFVSVLSRGDAKPQLMPFLMERDHAGKIRMVAGQVNGQKSQQLMNSLLSNPLSSVKIVSDGVPVRP
jgi:hypothetical protein